jgi:hypothetical protein
VVEVHREYVLGSNRPRVLANQFSRLRERKRTDVERFDKGLRVHGSLAPEISALEFHPIHLIDIFVRFYFRSFDLIIHLYIIVDLVTTLSETHRRSHAVYQEPKDWLRWSTSIPLVARAARYLRSVLIQLDVAFPLEMER